jgi:hypothetical protein
LGLGIAASSSGGSIFGIGTSIYEGRETDYRGDGEDSRDGRGQGDRRSRGRRVHDSHEDPIQEIRDRYGEGRGAGEAGADQARAHAPPHRRRDDGAREHRGGDPGELEVAEAEGEEGRHRCLGGEGRRSGLAEEGRQQPAEGEGESGAEDGEAPHGEVGQGEGETARARGIEGHHEEEGEGERGEPILGPVQEEGDRPYPYHEDRAQEARTRSRDPHEEAREDSAPEPRAQGPEEGLEGGDGEDGQHGKVLPREGEDMGAARRLEGFRFLGRKAVPYAEDEGLQETARAFADAGEGSPAGRACRAARAIEKSAAIDDEDITSLREEGVAELREAALDADEGA